jgi:hypothetical protein
MNYPLSKVRFIKAITGAARLIKSLEYSFAAKVSLIDVERLSKRACQARKLN